MIRRARRLLTGGKDAAGAATITVAVAGTATGSGSAHASLGKLDASVEDRLDHLQKQLDQMIATVDGHLRRAREAEARLATQMGEQTARLEAADARLQEMTTEIAVGSSALQLRGLVAVGFGTVLMAVPGNVAYLA